MKITSLFVVAALFGLDQTQAVQVRSRALSKSKARIGAMTLVDCELEYQRTGQVLAECQQYLQTGATATPAPVAAQVAAPMTAAAPVDNTMLNQAPAQPLAADQGLAQHAPVAPAQAAAPLQQAAAQAAPAQQ